MERDNISTGKHRFDVATWDWRVIYFYWLLLDSRVVDVPMAYNPTVVMLSSLRSLCFNSLNDEARFSDNVGAYDPGIP
jgi:hypothetical protein